MAFVVQLLLQKMPPGLQFALLKHGRTQRLSRSECLYTIRTANEQKCNNIKSVRFQFKCCGKWSCHFVTTKKQTPKCKQLKCQVMSKLRRRLNCQLKSKVYTGDVFMQTLCVRDKSSQTVICQAVHSEQFTRLVVLYVQKVSS